ncbi:MAG: ACT domain-containing protein, partial [Synergistaceae bacterium]|nr:ACT domain-containing protein [Synergistaceae bacterium]
MITFNDECVHVVFLGLPNVPGIAAEIFAELSASSVSVNMVTQNTMRGGRSDLSFLIPKDRLDDMIPVCRQVSDRVGG